MLTVAISKRNKLQNIIVLTPKDGIDGNWSNILTTFLMCAGGGMFGGMIS